MKKFTLSSDSLKPALKKLSQAVGSSAALPVLKNIFCKVTKDEVEFTTSDMELTISYKCTAETQGEPFELLLPFAFVNSITSLTKYAPICVEHPSSRKARITSSIDIYELGTLDKIEDYPKLPSVPKKNSVLLDANFVPMLLKAMHTASKADTNGLAMMKTCLDIKTGEMVLVSTDTIALYSHKINLVSKEADRLLFSAKMAKSLDGLAEIEVSWSEKMIAFKSGVVTVLTKRHEEKYPDYERIIPNHEPNLVMDRSALIDALHRACLSSVATKHTVMHLKSGGMIHFETDDTDYSRKITVNVPGEYTGEVEAVAFNAERLLTMMEQIEEGKVRFHIKAAQKPVLVSAEQDADYRGVFMPYAINN